MPPGLLLPCALTGIRHSLSRAIHPPWLAGFADPSHYTSHKGTSNTVAMDLIIRHVRTQMEDRGFDLVQDLNAENSSAPDSLHVLPATKQLRGLHTVSFAAAQCTRVLAGLPPHRKMRRSPWRFHLAALPLCQIIRDKEADRDGFVFYADRIMRQLIEHTLSLLPYEDVEVSTCGGSSYTGRRRIGEVRL